MLIKTIFIIPFVFLLLISTAFAENSCPADIKAIVVAAIKERNEQIKATYNAIMIDPADARDSLLNCLSNINSIGDMFSMGVTIPNLQSLLDKACSSANYAIQSKINNAMLQLEQKAIENLGGVNPFHVNINGEMLVDDLVKKIQ